MLTVDQPYGFGADRFGPISAVVVAMLVVLVVVAAWIACRPQLVRDVGKRVRDGAPLRRPLAWLQAQASATGWTLPRWFAVYQAAEAFMYVLVDDRDDLDWAPIGSDVKLEVHRPHPVRCVRAHQILRRRSAEVFAAVSSRDPQSFFTPESLKLLMIDHPAIAAGVVICRPEPTPRMVLGVGAEPSPQRRIRVLRRGCFGLMALGGAVLPGHAAGEPLADPQHPLEMTNGRPATFRA